MSKKNIDNLFQEKFRDFDEIPDQRVWNAIEASLDKKKSRKAFPVWWTMAGAAAVLLIALVIYPTSNETISTSVITNIDNRDSTDKKQIKNTEKSILHDASNENNRKKEEIQGAGTKVASIKEPTVERESSNSDAVITVNNQNKSNRYNYGANAASNTGVVNANSTSNQTKSPETSIASHFTNQNTVEEAELVDTFSSTDSRAVDSKQLTITDNSKRSGFASTSEQGDTSLDKQINNSATVSNKTPTQDIALQDNNVEKKSIFDEIDEKAEENIATTDNSSRWSAGPNIAPVYYNAVGEGSPVNSIFNENSKSGSTNLSYGLSVAYAVNKKLSIRSGINKVDYGYDTNDVAFTSTLQEASADKIQNIDYTSTAKNIVVTGENNFNSLSNTSYAFEVSNNNSQRNGTMAQQFGYLEVPLELDYALIDKKFGLNILGGLSSLFLLDNTVSLTSGDLTTEIGEANNVNSVNFSTNIGFGVNYKFTPKIRLNVEPVFKYQLNTFSDVSGDFNPFTIGVYSGLNFKF